MENLFLKRATEHLRDQEAFLSVVTPEPLTYFIKPHVGQLFDRLVVIRGTPGSGKTTLARLFEYPALATLLRNRDISAYGPMIEALSECGAIRDGNPTVMACRISLETDYREMWDFPYPEDVRLGLMTALIQARAVLAWLRSLGAFGVAQDQVAVVPRESTMAAAEAMGGTEAASIALRAREMERALYAIIAALVAPDISAVDPVATSAYRPFDVIERLPVCTVAGAMPDTLDLLPVVILDDAHALHPSQIQALQRWLVRRELRVGRWVMTRLDVLHPDEAFLAVSRDRVPRTDLPGITAQRDVTEIMLQSSLAEKRRGQRLAFRKMSRDMANRYLRRMPVFHSRGLDDLANLLGRDLPSLAASKQRQLETSVIRAQESLSISEGRRKELLSLVDSYRPESGSVPEHMRLAMLRIAMHRYAKRTPQRALPGMDADPEPARQISVDRSVWDAARVHLLHEYEYPFYFGIDDLCDASSENAEQFLRLAAALVDAIHVQVVRSKPPTVAPATQHRLLTQRAKEIMRDWDFPECDAIRQLVSAIGSRCRAVTLEPNAWLGAGANAYGVVQEDFNRVHDIHPGLARILKFAIAYNAITLVPRYPCKQREWCLIELGGIVSVSEGLTLKRGGFIEGTLSELVGMATGRST